VSATLRPAPLTRAAFAESRGEPVAPPPVRIVHVGLGAFHRAHQAWYTAAADDASDWGIAAFTGRSADVADKLAPQGGLYTVLERSEAGSTVQVVSSIVEAVDGADVARFVELVAAPTTALVSLTITESGYRLAEDGSPDTDDPIVRADVDWLTSALAGETLTDLAGGGPASALGRLVLALEARRRAGAGPLAVVPCDNIPDNGDFVRRGLTALADAVSGDTAAWIRSFVSFVSTSVDRITPKTTDDDLRESAALSGWIDRAPVVTEPFKDWVLQGEFPAGRPRWETAGARFVDEIEPFERRKLWLLNGAHTLLAYTGLLRGHETVADAIGDPELLSLVERFWDEAGRHLPPEGLDLPGYRGALLRRFRNARIEHRLSQIGMEGVTKLRVRFADVARAELREGRDASASAHAFAAWIALLRSGVRLPDARGAAVETALGSGDPDAPGRLVALVDQDLARSPRFMRGVGGRPLA
jgi:fructuronate reductase